LTVEGDLPNAIVASLIKSGEICLNDPSCCTS
jgi:hypothetical protein